MKINIALLIAFLRLAASEVDDVFLTHMIKENTGKPGFNATAYTIYYTSFIKEIEILNRQRELTIGQLTRRNMTIAERIELERLTIANQNSTAKSSRIRSNFSTVTFCSKQFLKLGYHKDRGTRTKYSWFGDVRSWIYTRIAARFF
ncbi:hypothetical protein AYI70_g10915 [Smittium culicis]|uniref:Uncharacterized protein n=1 Tax=Smittium culicis TaxID=133412 RepID=A0A1R1X491_9FUNG|nr:hypothetical protein AYI70_g10915 [Smittium culicis]